MGALLDIWIKKETLEQLAKTQQKGVAITVSVNDNTNDYGQNTTAYVSQSKEDREAKKDKYYVGNGKVFWTDGNIVKAEYKEQGGGSQSKPSNDKEDDLPF